MCGQEDEEKLSWSADGGLTMVLDMAAGGRRRLMVGWKMRKARKTTREGMKGAIDRNLKVRSTFLT